MNVPYSLDVFGKSHVIMIIFQVAVRGQASEVGRNGEVEAKE